MSAMLVAYVAGRLDDDARAHLLGDRESAGGRARLKRIGAVDAAGRLTALGVRLARFVIADEAEPSWTEADSIALTAALVADGAVLTLRRGAEMREAVIVLARRGLSSEVIAARVGCTRENAALIARQAGVPIGRAAQRVVITEEDKRKILACPRGRAALR